jgi:subtilisin family serine protease
MTPPLWQALLLALVAWASAAGAALPDASAGSAPTAAEAPRMVLMMLRLPPQHLRPNADYGGGYGDAMQRAALRRVAGRLARSNGLTLVDDWPMPLVGVDCFVLAAPGDRPLADVAAQLSRAPEVAWAQPMNLYRGQGAAPAPRLFLAEPAVREWRLEDLHKVATGRNVRVAVIDSMVDAGHPDLVGQVETRQNFAPTRGLAPEQHGTAVAGVIAAKGVGIDGVAPGARLMALRACWQAPAESGKAQQTLCDSLSLAKALDFAVNHSAQVINLSLGGPTDPLLGKLIDAAEGRRIAVVAAFDPGLPAGGFPASHQGVIAVADESWGAPPAGVYSAPGRDVPTTTPGGHWALVNGSSFAAAHVSGLVALLRERRPGVANPPRLGQRLGGGVDPCALLLGVSCEKERASLPDPRPLARR